MNHKEIYFKKFSEKDISSQIIEDENTLHINEVE